ncbi:zinc ribbon domain-containing protein [Desulfovibrio sp. UCD-KL4C]|uniref:FmdB family zinc ribbon protein n=1 Tax=Desulfovibrio sp. UCD-KL4C TaxID=2578120 RepID=UPI0025BDADAC|nr:zinc ribbon domain-containing protein [Desulfovibrio sp. UCD-KL4C]
MPIYEFKCADCGKVFEELVFNRDECPPCPECKSTGTEKLISACKFKNGGASDSRDMGAPAPSAPSSGGGCSGCSGGNCSSCG